MKANRSVREEGFAFIVPMTMAIVVGIALLTIGAFVVGEITSTLEDSFPDNKNHSGTWDMRSTNQNKTVNLMGNISDGFADIVDIEIVVIIITALAMAIFSILAVGSRPQI